MTGASVDPAADVFVIVDTSVTTDKKILVQEAFNALSTLAALTGASVEASADSFPIYDNSATTEKSITGTELGNFIFSLAHTNVGTLTRDLTAASGSVAKTGVGFAPKSVIFLCGFAGGANAWSAGIDDGTTHGDLFNDSLDSANIYTLSVSHSIAIVSGVGNNQTASIASMDSDGFTLSWTKSGSPTGTATIVYIAIR